MHDRNFGEEADLVREMDCACLTRGRERTETLNTLAELREFDRSLAPCRGDVVAAHVTARGMGGAKGGRCDLVPLCDGHHREAGETRTSRRADFERRYGLDLRVEADRIALEHEPPLGLRGLAARWAARCPYCRKHPGRDIRDGICTSCPDCNGSARVTPGSPAHADGVAAGLIEPLDTYETEALMGWVRRRMARELERRAEECRGAPKCGQKLEGQFGWIHGFTGWRRCTSCWDRESLAHAVAAGLGGEFIEDPHGEHGRAWSLCEWATEGRWVS